ncbi:hypothetical protein [Methylobacterium currus]|jgi:hypothetical protein|uniref:hypothetical protein n=1 Tax=Methylobacterium currus TaxID=2051553 RepID=UPI000F4F34AC
MQQAGTRRLAPAIQIGATPLSNHRPQAAHERTSLRERRRLGHRHTHCLGFRWAIQRDRQQTSQKALRRNLAGCALRKEFWIAQVFSDSWADRDRATFSEPSLIASSTPPVTQPETLKVELRSAILFTLIDVRGRVGLTPDCMAISAPVRSRKWKKTLSASTALSRFPCRLPSLLMDRMNDTDCLC